MKLPKRALLMMILSIILALSFSTAAFAAPSLTFPNGSSNSPNYVSSPPDFIAWNQSTSDKKATITLWASNGFTETIQYEGLSGDRYGVFYLIPSLKNDLPRNIPVRVTVSTYNSIGNYTGSDTAYFVIQN
ncbi:hypothetical protein ACFCP7_28125 [Paenibacillus elgii]